MAPKDDSILFMSQKSQSLVEEKSETLAIGKLDSLY
jgi:hypothetical protein